MDFAAFLKPEIKTYIDQLSAHNDPLLVEMEAVAAQRHFPIIGPVVGRFLYQTTMMRKATRIFELGSGCGCDPTPPFTCSDHYRLHRITKPCCRV